MQVFQRRALREHSLRVCRCCSLVVFRWKSNLRRSWVLTHVPTGLQLWTDVRTFGGREDAEVSSFRDGGSSDCCSIWKYLGSSEVIFRVKCG